MAATPRSSFAGAPSPQICPYIGSVQSHLDGIPGEQIQFALDVLNERMKCGRERDANVHVSKFAVLFQKQEPEATAQLQRLQHESRGAISEIARPQIFHKIQGEFERR